MSARLGTIEPFCVGHRNQLGRAGAGAALAADQLARYPGGAFACAALTVDPNGHRHPRAKGRPAGGERACAHLLPA